MHSPAVPLGPALCAPASEKGCEWREPWAAKGHRTSGSSSCCYRPPHCTPPLHVLGHVQEASQQAAILKTLNSLKRESRLFFLGHNSIWSLPSVSFLGDYSNWRFSRFFFALRSWHLERSSSVSSNHRIAQENEEEESRLLNFFKRLRSSRNDMPHRELKDLC